MKKTIYSIATLFLGFFASCTEDTFEKAPLMSADEIGYEISGVMNTRGAMVNDDNLSTVYSTMNIVAFDSKGNPVIDESDEAQFEIAGTGNLIPNKKYYWPTTSEDYDFFVTPALTADLISGCTYENGIASFTYSIPTSDKGNDGVNAPDLIMAHTKANKNTNKGLVSLNFEHALTAIEFVYSNPKIGHQISEIKIEGAYDTADCTFDSEGETVKFAWSEQTGKATLSQKLSNEVNKASGYTNFGDKVSMEKDAPAATFMLIPGGTDNITFSVNIDGKWYSQSYAHEKLEPGKVLQVVVTDADNILTVKDKTNATKKYTQNADGTWNLTLEAWTTGTTVLNPQPADICIVVDVSGSMEELMSEKYIPVTKDFTYSNTQGYYYSPDDGDHYYKVKRVWDVVLFLGANTYLSVDVEEKGKTVTKFLYDNSIHDSKPSNWGHTSIFWEAFNKEIYNGTLYYNPTRMEATRDAINTFLAEVSRQSESLGEGKKHKVSLVKFAGDNNDKTGNDFYGSSNYSQIVSDWSDPTNEDFIKAIDGLKEGGATSADYGMAHAETLFESARSYAAKVLVMLTDGEPNHGSGFSSTVANSTITSSKKLKDKDVTVWSVYVGDQISNTSNTWKYMQGVSSNYPNATSYTNLGTKNTSDTDYFTNATEPEGLNNVFTSVAESIAAGVMDETTQIKDIFSNAFEIPSNDNVKVEYYTVDCTGYKTSEDVVTSWSSNEVEAPASVSHKFEGNTLFVTGFDFNANYCGIKNNKATGKKLVIKVKGLTPKSAEETGSYFTNAYGSGIYVGGEMISSFIDKDNPTSGNGNVIPLEVGN